MKTLDLTVRLGEKPVTNDLPPHLQQTQQSPRDIYEQLADWAFKSFPDAKEHETLISVPSSRALWLDEKIDETPNDAFMPPAHSREFAHLHLDGSIHVCLPENLNQEIYQNKWGEPHPYKHMGVNEVLFYAPRTMDELEFMKRVIIASYEYASGQTYQA